MTEPEKYLPTTPGSQMEWRVKIRKRPCWKCRTYRRENPHWNCREPQPLINQIYKNE